ncbi:metalloregulator ArsR/SmtB family transcription factor [Kineosporia rhizophila]|uniref:ArsR/SmtB family transcription factor n=1 Tax=Kineosporia TaxID=49184 RepID=UPI000A83E7CF|nr:MULTISPECIES: metalloregulator ArsR/SmtB family transcription factor [Kineosporia]MCE0535466.1 metalloregulator ArsR/SmtB family transcription factor [Kineosporia rhizophila]GLY16747.1 putative transcriptional regulator, ArsR family protein [Kineosporia sp. NBRC 101677]
MTSAQTARPRINLQPSAAAATTKVQDASCCTPTGTGPIPGVEEAQKLATLLKALAEPTRLQLLSLVAAHEGGEACVCDLTAPVGLSQPTVSHHLKILVDAGLLTREKRGVWAYYTLVPERLTQITAALGDFTTPQAPTPQAAQ